MGDYPFFLELEKYLKDMIERDVSADVTAFAELALASAYTGMVIPDMAAEWLKKGDLSALHPMYRLYALHTRTVYFRCLGQFEAMLSTAQTALYLSEPPKGFASYHDCIFRLMCAVASVGLGRTEEAKSYLLEVMAGALPHGQITFFTEISSLLGGLLERCLEQEYPEYADAVMRQSERTVQNWLQFHSRFMKDHITHALTIREHAIATLVARRVSREKIAGQFNISVKMVDNIIGTVFGKLGITRRDELAGYVLDSVSKTEKSPNK
jgi:DNA-binding CsgD family transcriptional regulator